MTLTSELRLRCVGSYTQLLVRPPGSLVSDLIGVSCLKTQPEGPKTRFGMASQPFAD
jgi:hypothetical protein